MAELQTYRILDSGDGRKLEQVGPARLDRQAATATWAPRRPRAEWEKVHAVHVRSASGGGHWDVRQPLPDDWRVQVGGLELVLQATPFGHLGFFAEHAMQWDWLRERVRASPRAQDGELPRVLHLFAYTGAATVACAAAGARVTHVDAAGPIVEWARRNARANEIAQDRIRWIVEDANAFVRREVRRGEHYEGIVLDPPTYGRIGRKQWRIEEALRELLEGARALLAERGRFALLTCHTPGYTGIALENLLGETVPAGTGPLESGELWVAQEDGRRLPSGFFARWRAEP
jgi:23S rRNA (cytosine1962-C5)-methyltransferase